MSCRFSTWVLSCIAYSLLMITHSSSTDAAASPSKNYRAEGAITCSTAACHGSVSALKGTSILRNEFSKWIQHDSHSSAYRVLLNDHSKTIARHLGIQSPEKDETCLTCHSSLSLAGNKGSQFRIEDGVSCESCHGSSEKYLKTHSASDSSHAENLKNGMIDLSNPIVAANTCLNCHEGTSDNFINHRLYGAGHPRITFELDSYIESQPKHFNLDEDYIKRKGPWSPTRNWIAGQLVRSKRLLQRWLSPPTSAGNVQPVEFAGFYCYSCHHGLHENQFKQRNYQRYPGQIKPNLSSLWMVEIFLKSLHDKKHAPFSDSLLTIVYEPDLNKIKELDRLLDQIIENFDQVKIDPTKSKSLLTDLSKFGSEANEMRHFEVAEQVIMGISSLNEDNLNNRKEINQFLDSAYRLLEKPDQYQPENLKKLFSKTLKP